MLRKAVDIRTIQLGPDSDLTIEAQIALANVFRVQGKSSEAEVTLRKVCEHLTKNKGTEAEETLLALGTLSRVLIDRGSFDEAER
jgi:lipopolysaccharide biosynthesis regulator YciM